MGPNEELRRATGHWAQRRDRESHWAHRHFSRGKDEGCTGVALPVRSLLRPRQPHIHLRNAITYN